MIFTERTITVVNDSATINKPLILYRGDKNIELKITIAESQFKFRNTDASNVIETTDASYAQLVINTPYNSPIFSDVAATKNGAVIFVITEAMIDEIREVGAYEIQIRLLDDNKQSRASIPPVSNAIEIREPIAIEDGSAVDSNAVNVAKVNRALTTTSAPLEAFDSQGNYIKKTWGDGDPITDAALNKMETGIDGVNKKIGNVRSQIKDIPNIYAKKEDIGTIQDNSVTENKTTFCHVGLNKFNPDEVEYGYLDKSNGEFCEELTGIYVSSGFIKVNKDDVLTIYEFGNGYPIVFTRVCEYNNNKEFIVYTDVNNSKYTVKNDGYIRFYSNKNQVTTEGCKVAVTINYNMTNETYEDFGYETSLKVEYAKKSKYATNSKHAEVSDSALNFDGAIETKNLNFVKIGLNKFNPDEVEYGYLDNSNGEVHKEDGQYVCSGFVKVSSGDVVSVWGISSGTGYAVYDAAKTFVKFVSQATFENINIDNDGYIRICFYKNLLSQTWSIYNSITINFPTPTTDYYRKFEYLIDEDKLLIDNNAYGKIVSCLGDSITQQGTVANLNGWQLLLKDKLALARIVNCGIGGSCVSGSTDDAMWQDTRINAIDERSDFIIFMGGTNDWLQNKDIGTIDSVDTNTFYGALNTIVRKLFTRCPNAKIIFAGTIFGKPSNSALTNSYKDYSDAIKAVALKYNIKFIDTSNLMCVNEFNYTNFYQNEEGNYIHPNTLGGKRLYEIMLKELL